MGFDIFVVIIALIFGGKLGVVTVLMAFVLGPVIEFVGTMLQKLSRLMNKTSLKMGTHRFYFPVDTHFVV